MQFFTKGAEAVEGKEATKDSTKKKKKDKKYEAKPQRMPDGIQPNNMGTHDIGMMKNVSMSKSQKKGFISAEKEQDPYDQNPAEADNRSNSHRSRKSNIHQPDNYDGVAAQEASKNNSKFMRTRSHDANDSMEFDKKEQQQISKKPLYGGDVSAIIHRSIDDYNTVMNKTNQNVDPSAAYGLTDIKKNRRITFEKGPYDNNQHQRFLRPQDSLNSLMDEFLGGKEAAAEQMAPQPEDNKK